MISKQYNSIFVTHRLSPVINKTKDISDSVCTLHDHDVTLQTEYDDICMETKLF